MGMQHLEAFKTLEGVEPLAVPARPGRISALVEAGYQAVLGLEDALGMGVRQAVIATDPGRHVDDGLSALGYGLDLLVEKPLAPTACEAASLLREARAHARRLFVGCVLRFAESLQTFREWVPLIGSVHGVRIECHSFLPQWRPARAYRESYSAREQEGGVLRDLIHEIDYAGWIFGWPARLQARVKNLGRLGIAAEEIAELQWETSSGALLSISLDYLSKPTRRRMQARGEHGAIEWDGQAGMVTLAAAEAPERIFRSPQTREGMLVEQARGFLSAAQGATEARLASGEDGLKALVVCEAARQASRERREVQVTY